MKKYIFLKENGNKSISALFFPFSLNNFFLPIYLQNKHCLSISCRKKERWMERNADILEIRHGIVVRCEHKLDSTTLFDFSNQYISFVYWEGHIRAL